MRATWSGDAIVLHVPRAVLDETTYPAVLDPLVGPETSIDAPISMAPDSTQNEVHIGASASQFYVIWYDARRRLGSTAPTARDLYGARLDPVKGTVVPDDRAGVLLAPDQVFADTEPLVVSAGGDFLVLYVNDGLLEVLRIDGTTGQPLASDQGGLPLVQLLGGYGGVAASIGDRYIVAWQTGDTIFAQRFGRSGPPIDPSPVVIATAGAAGGVNIACGGAQCLVEWTDNIAFASLFVRYDPATGQPIPEDVGNPHTLQNPYVPYAQDVYSLTYGAGTYLMTWGENFCVTTTALSGALFDPVAVAFTDPVTLIDTPAPNTVTVRYDGARFVAGVAR